MPPPTLRHIATTYGVQFFDSTYTVASKLAMMRAIEVFEKLMAGYSNKPLGAKLGIQAGMRVCFIHAPAGYSALLEPLPQPLYRLKTLGENLDFIHFFGKEKSRLQQQFPALKKALNKDGMLWISWPKKSAGVVTDLNENDVRAIGLESGLVDVKVCAVDEIWSGLKFVYRKQDR